ncbi:MAG: hypothetical protein ACREFO_15790 [Acetobacteraceae bacterium]
MKDVAIVLGLHVLAIVIWIGGVGFATLALLPALRGVSDPDQRSATFRAIENRFAPVARGSVLVAGASGVYMLARLDLWNAFAQPAMWWMSAMVAVWLAFAALLFVVEPFFLHRRMLRRAGVSQDVSFRKLERLHWILLIAALVTIFGATAGSRGLFLGG